MGDVRLDERGRWFVERIVAKHSLVLKTVGGDRAGELALNRYLGHADITPAGILAPHVARTAAAARGRRIVVPQDTTEVNFAGRARRRRDLGPAGDGVSPGFFAHVLIGVDADTEDVLGPVGAEIWTRPLDRGEDRAAATDTRAFEEKESWRWLSGARTAADVLAGAAQRIVTGDRENDIYACFAGRPAGVELIVRAAQNRRLADGASVKTAAADWPLLARCAVAVAAKPAGAKGGPTPARTARVELRAGRITVLPPKGRKDEPGIELGLVVASEVDAPAGVEPLLWRLLTTLPVTTAALAAEVVRLYRLRHAGRMPPA